MHERIKLLIDRIDNAAASSDDAPDTRLQKTLVIFLSAAGIFLVPLGAAYLYREGMQVPALVALAFACLSVASLTHLLITRSIAYNASLLLAGLLLTPFMLQWTMGGYAASGSILLWALLAPLGALVFQGTRIAVAWFAAYSFIALASTVQDIAFGTPLQQVLLYCENVLLVSSLAFFSMRFFVIERGKAQSALEREKARSEALLLNILPAPIAERLKASHQTIADGYAEATILFADLVGFTKLSTKATPKHLVEMLNRLFSRFDELSGRYGVEKIKTIGDAYMACAGVPIARPDHAEAVADMALAMHEALDAHNREFHSALQLRIGINTGPVVAGVIGLKKFIYDLWGDTVNLASRMESHGIPNRIQVSAATWERLRDHYEFEARGTVKVKGIGPIETYFLEGRKADVDPARPAQEAAR